MGQDATGSPGPILGESEESISPAADLAEPLVAVTRWCDLLGVILRPGPTVILSLAPPTSAPWMATCGLYTGRAESG